VKVVIVTISERGGEAFLGIVLFGRFIFQVPEKSGVVAVCASELPAKNVKRASARSRFLMLLIYRNCSTSAYFSVGNPVLLYLTFAPGRITVGNRDYHHLSRFEIDGGKRISQHLSTFPPETDHG